MGMFSWVIGGKKQLNSLLKNKLWIVLRFFMIKGNLNYDQLRQLQIKTASQIELQKPEQVLMIFLDKKVYMLISLGPALL